MQLFNGDCLEVMKSIPDKSVDMVLCDLPYGTTACKWDNVIPFEPLWECYNRIIKDNGAIVLFGIEPFTSYLICSNVKHFKQKLTWKKHKAGNFGNAKYMHLKYTEDIVLFGNGRVTYNPQFIPRKSERVRQAQKNGNLSWNTANKTTGELSFGTSYEPRSFKVYNADYKYPEDVIEIPAVVSTSKEKVNHPTQKPVKLLEYLIKTYTNENQVVLDNCMGSGSTGVAAVKNHRDFIGIELDKKYFEIAKERINEAAMLNSIAYKSTVGRSD